MSQFPAWYIAALGELGQREIAGAKDNPRVVEYHGATAGGDAPDEVPWCSSFANWCFKQAGIVGTRNKAASSWAAWGTGLILVSGTGPVKDGAMDLRVGCVCVFGKHDPDAKGTGHVAFAVAWDGEWVWVLGGNQTNAVTIARRKRADIVATRWPAGVA